MLRELRPGGRGGSLRDAETNRITAQWTLASASASPRRASSCVAAAPRIEPDEALNSSDDEVDPDEIDVADMGHHLTGEARAVHFFSILIFLTFLIFLVSIKLNSVSKNVTSFDSVKSFIIFVKGSSILGKEITL